MSRFPKLRPDLETYEHHDGPGLRRVVLKDPVSQKFYRLSHYERRFLEELDGETSIEQARENLRQKLYYYSEEDAELIIKKAMESGLVLAPGFGSASRQKALKGAMARARKSARLSSVYFLFIPILNPDRFLGATLWVFNIFWNRITATLLAPASIVALYLILEGIPRIRGEYLYFFNLRNLFYLWVTIALVKLVHEFAHAYSAKRYGLHVPQMGIAFLIFFPCLYCNTTDAWRLAARRERMAISAAGVLSEIALAVIATYIWRFSKPGVINSLSFYLMGVSLISTLLFNGNPLLKFDGYFVLADYLRIPNLYSKSFAQIKYLFMNRVLGMTQIETPATDAREKAIFTTYGISSFIYRIFLYVGIIAGVYYRFDKTIGIALALLAFTLFVARPIIRGIMNLFRWRKLINPRPRGALALLAILIAGILALGVPLPSNSTYPCYLDSARRQKMTVPLHTWISEVNVSEGDSVEKGETLYRLDPKALELRLSNAITSQLIVEKELKMLLLDENRSAKAPAKHLELLQAKDETARIREKLAEAKKGFTAPFNGVVTRLDPKMKKGFQPGAGVIVGEVESILDCFIHALIPEEDLGKIKQGQAVRVKFHTEDVKLRKVRIKEVRPFSERNLQESPFSSRFGGELATEVTNRGEKDAPLEALYDCVIDFENRDPIIPLGMTGRLIVSSRPRSLGSIILNKARRTFNRESLL
jgi:putative peptide zinc metalloprotease protein